MDAVTLDQFAVFVGIVDAGSFAAAARRMNRAQSAITYAIQRLEEQSQVALFDRSAYRPTLTLAGHALLPRARRILDDVSDYRALASGLAHGHEAKVSLMVHAFAPITLIVSTLKAFHATFPMAQARVSIESAHVIVEALTEGWGDLALMAEFRPLASDLERHVCGFIDLVAVAAPEHPLAGMRGPIAPTALRDHVQLVLSDRSTSHENREFGVHAVNSWHVTDLNTKHYLLRGGLGWGSMPADLVARDLRAGRLVELDLERWEGIDQMPRFPLVVAHGKSKALGPASRWLIERFKQSRNEGADGFALERHAAR